jgi:hypothetical protein
MAMKPKPVKITGTATGYNDKKAVNFKNVQKVNKTATKVTAPVKKTAPAKPMPNNAKKVTPKPKPMETKRVGGIISVPVKPKKTIY